MGGVGLQRCDPECLGETPPHQRRQHFAADPHDARTDAADIPRILLDKLCEVFGFTRGVILASPEQDLALFSGDLIYVP